MTGSIFRLFIMGLVFQTVLTTVYADEVKDNAIREDRQKLHGTWRITSIEVKGNKMKPDDVRDFTVVNGSDGTWSLRSSKEEISKGTSVFDPTQNPKTIDFTAKDQEESSSYVGIYEIGERTRKLCFVPVGTARPREFSSAVDNANVLVILERIEK